MVPRHINILYEETTVKEEDKKLLVVISQTHLDGLVYCEDVTMED